jgi:ABC-type lipoprotein export system ATPase subunit
MNPETPLLLESTDITKAYGKGPSKVDVLHGLNFKLHKGEIVGLMGSSGSGKSTLLQILGLMDNLDSGKIIFEGKDLCKLSPKKAALFRAKSLGFVFQQFHLIPELNAIENILLSRRVALGWQWWGKRKQERAHAQELLNEVGLSNRGHHRPNELSGGEQQRVAIARALISSPPIILADEPTGNLDSQTGEEILQLLIELTTKRQSSVLLATHDKNIANQCNRIIHLSDGKIIDS